MTRERRCSIEGCDAKHFARGWCHKHYERWRRYGDPSIVFPRGGDVRRSRLGYKEPMDDWEKEHVDKMLNQGMSYRAIERALGVGYMTVYRFNKKRKMCLT